MSKEYELAFRMNAELDAKFSRVFTSASGKIGELEEKLNELEKESKGVKKSGDQMSSAFTAIGNSAKFAAGAIGKIATGGILLGGAAIGGAGALIYNFTASAAEGMAQLQASTGATSVQMEELKKISKALYKDGLGDDFGDLSQSLATVTQVTKLQGEALQQTTQYAIAYRDVFGEDIAESIKANDTMMKNFKISSSDAFNLLAQGAQNGLNKSNELLDSANEYAPHFASLGFSANQMFDTFSAGLENGAFNLDKVGDAIKEFNIRSKDMSKTSVNAYKALGFNAEEMSRTFAEGGPTAQIAFKKIVKALSSVKDPVKKNTIGVELFGTQFEDLEKDVIKAMGEARSQFDMTNKTMDKVLDDKYDTPRRGWQKIGRTIQTELLLPIGEKLLPYMNDFSDATKRFADKYAPQIATSVTKAIDQVNEYINKHYINNPDFQKLETIESKVGFVFDDLWGAFQGWLAAGGQDKIDNISRDLMDGFARAIEMGTPRLTEAAVGLAKSVGGSLVGALKESIAKDPVAAAILGGATGGAAGGAIAGPGGAAFGAAAGAAAGTAQHYTDKGSNWFRDNVMPGYTDFANQGWVKSLTNAALETVTLGRYSNPGSKQNSLDGYAEGGFANRPSIFGEAGEEAAIPINNKPRSRALWAETGRRMGLLGSGGGDTFTYSPTIIVPGGDEQTVKRAVTAGHSDFQTQMARFKAQQRRVSYSQ